MFPIKKTNNVKLARKPFLLKAIKGGFIIFIYFFFHSFLFIQLFIMTFGFVCNMC